MSLTLNWEESTGATSYEYCYATSALACTTWISTSTNTQASLTGLSASTTYYWHVRAKNDFGTTYSNGDVTTLWSFTTGDPPGPFGKTTPANGAPDQILNPTLTWGASSDAVSYEYCYGTSTGSCTNWTSTNLTTAGLTGLSASTTYYWHVRAINSFGVTYSDGSSTAFWSFRTGDPPGAFVKTSPADDATSQLLNVKLDWDASAGAVSYEYCIDTLNDNACSTWNSTGTATEIMQTGLDTATTYYWHVRAINAYGITYSNGSASAYWSFTTISAAPAAFSKTYPANNAKEVPLDISATWQTSTGVEYYEYCLDTTNDSPCSTNWTSNGTSTQKLFGGLEPSTTYYWHVRAVNSLGTTYSNGSETAFWSFTTIHPWYLAEGYTGPGYSTFILIQNPNPEKASIYVEYMPESGGVIARTHEVDPYSRYTIAAVLDVGENQAFSSRLTADRFIVVERAMYWPNGDGTSGGHVSSAIAFPKNTWYLAEGYTGDGFETFILIQNPNDVPANVSLTYMIEGGENVTREVIVAAKSRFTVVTNYATQVGENAAFSTKLVSDQPVVVERAMYFNNEGHVVGGVTSPQNTWYLAEGFTGDGTETFILIQNPNATASDVTLTYMLQGGGVETRAVSILANSRKTIRVNDVDQLGDGLAFSTKVTAAQPIIVERAMYWNNGVGSNAGHASTGVTASATTWYLAEGYTGSGFSTYILIQNPNASSVNVTLTYMVDGGGTFVKTLTIPANSRATVATQDASQMGLDAIFSTKVTGNLPIIVERAMYFLSGGHNAAGVIPE